jgi:tRNA-dihydrouridine synthase
MVGRMAYNTPWDLVRIDRELYGDETSHSKNREELLQEYADYCQQEQDEWQGKEEYIPNSIFVKPIINLFSHEYEGT